MLPTDGGKGSDHDMSPRMHVTVRTVLSAPSPCTMFLLRLQVDACVPMVSLPYFLEFLDNLSIQRITAAQLQRTLKETIAKMAPARLRLAPTAQALQGLATQSSQATSDLRGMWADAIFAQTAPLDLPGLRGIPATV